MGRKPGAKNKTPDQKVADVIVAIGKIEGLNETEKAEAIDELDDLLSGNVSELPADPIPATDDTGTSGAESSETPAEVNPPVSGDAGNDTGPVSVPQTEPSTPVELGKLIGYHPVTGKPVYQ